MGKLYGKNLLQNRGSSNMEEDLNINIACILDEFSYECFRFEANFIQLGISNWRELMIQYQPKMFFVEAAWEGYNKEWSNKISNLHLTKDKSLLSIIDYCNKNNIPTVFWAKEDPYDFNIFIETAKHFDYIFTTDSTSVSKYKERLNRENIFLLPFAAQPKIHNPIDKDKNKIGKVGFAGGWYNKFPERCEEIENILKPAFEYGLVIYDRFKDSIDQKNSFPLEYKPFIKQSLDYLEMVKEYKKYDLFLNVNSTSISPTTFSRRIFELLASGIPVISSYSKGIEEFFKDMVLLSNNKFDTEIYLDFLLNNREARDELSILGQREVFNYHTYAHRLETVLTTTGLQNEVSRKESVSVITCTNRPHALKNILYNYLSQKYLYKELIIIINNDSIDLNLWQDKISKYEDISIYKLSEKATLGKCLNFAIDQSKYPYISKLDDDDFYGPNYLTDMMNAFKYTDASVIGKKTIFAYLEGPQLLVVKYPNQEYRYSEYVSGSTLTVKKELFNYLSFPDLSRGEDTRFLMDCINMGVKIYGADRFNHVVIRRQDISSHSWQISESEFLKNCKVIRRTTDFKKDVII